MAKTNDPNLTVKVAEMLPREGAHIGKPNKIVTSSMRMVRAGSCGMGGGGGGGGFGTTMGSGGNFYSPELSTDFLELPQSLDEMRNYFRFFYNNDPFVGQAIDQHGELPLSKVRLRMPEAKSRDLAERAFRFCSRWAKKNRLLHLLEEIAHEYWLLGEVFIFPEDTSPDMPREVTHELYREVTPDGDLVDDWREYEDANERALQWLKENYFGWSTVRILPPEQIHMESFPFTDEVLIELVPDSKTKAIVQKAHEGDSRAQQIVASMPQDVVLSIAQGANIPLNTDPDAGSFCYYMARKKSQYEPRGKSILQRCLRTLTHRDKLRQAQASIASRHMTPYRVVSGEDLSADQVEELREQVDLALMDPDYSIITNFSVTWEEMGADNRLLDLSSEYDLTDRQLYAGLGVTESLLSGESSYSGDRINLEVINTRYMLFRETLQDFVEEYLFEPMCRRMGFVETDEDGIEYVVVPKLSFTRLAIRDSADVFDHLFNLYSKGSIDIDVILDLLNIDPVTTLEKLNRDLFTLNDPTFNEVLRGLYGRAADDIAENSNVAKKIATETLGLQYEKADEEGNSRFASLKTAIPNEAKAKVLRALLADLQRSQDKEPPTGS